jgi:5-methylcytosine-specific restriction endonuclease McrA
VLHTRVIASHVLRLYLPQTASFVVGDNPVALRQITSSSSKMFAAVASLQQSARTAGCRTGTEVAQRLPDAYEAALDEVERTFARYPILRLQVVGGHDLPFLYDVDWAESVTLPQLHRPHGGLVRFRPQAADGLVRLGPLLRPLIETHWTRMVAALNNIDLDEERLRAHLFGTSRRSFPHHLRAGLADLHDRRCFYCGQPLSGRFDIDHLIPWSRHPNDAVENLVPADPRCNNDKRDQLPATTHVARWIKQLDDRSDWLATLAAQSNWQSDRTHTVAIARSTYHHLAPGTPLWLGPRRVETYDGHLGVGSWWTGE